MTLQWQDELEAKFGLAFQIVDRERLAQLRRTRGFGVNPWSTGSRFIVSHRLLTDETYTAGLRMRLGEFRARSMLILDEAHHAAPASGSRYAVDSQFTRAMREIVQRFEHRLFLSATPHNGHSNSFSSLLEMLDQQRFTRGVEVKPGDLEPVMVRRLKADLRTLGKSFPERVIEPIVLDGLPPEAPELKLAAMLADYQELRERRLATLPVKRRRAARLLGPAAAAPLLGRRVRQNTGSTSEDVGAPAHRAGGSRGGGGSGLRDRRGRGRDDIARRG